MSGRIRTTCVRELSAALIAGLIGLPLTLAAGPQEKTRTAPESTPKAAGPNAILQGRVTDENDAPVADVRILIAIPAVDMRFMDWVSDSGVEDFPKPKTRLDARTDAKGNYRLEIPGLTKPAQISIDAMKPGYRRLSGTLMRGGDARKAEVIPGKVAESSMTLVPALHFAGTVVDEQGKPIPSVQIAAAARSSSASGGIEITVSDADGAFAIFNYSIKPETIREEVTKGRVSFEHPHYLYETIDDVYALEQDRRTVLRIVLKSGRTIGGTVVDSAGKPVAGALVKATRNDGDYRKGTLSDAEGRFVLRGLAEGVTRLAARSWDIKARRLMPIGATGDKKDVEIRLQPIEMPAGLKTYSVLGMTLADVTPALRDAYELHLNQGAVILEPGKDFDRLKIGRITEGDFFWVVGDGEIRSVRDFLEQLLALTAGQNADEFSIRIVYGFSRVDGEGNNTQYLKFTKDERKQMEEVLFRIVNPQE